MSLNLPPNEWAQKYQWYPKNDFYQGLPDLPESEEVEDMSVSLQFYPRVVQVKDGYIGQLVLSNHIVWESKPQETEEEGEAIVATRIITAMQTLFEIVPDLSVPSKELSNGNV